MYYEVQAKNHLIILILDSGSSEYIALANFLKQVNISIDCSSIVVIIGVHSEQKQPLEKFQENGDKVERCRKCSKIGHNIEEYIFDKEQEVETIYINREKKDFKLELLMSEQE
ncbi:41508_t:CDS:2, partial [Gigaspora margarita]